MILNVIFPDGAIAPGMEAYAVLPAAARYGHKWQQTRKKTDVVVKKVCILQIASTWDKSRQMIDQCIDICPLGYAESLDTTHVDCMYTVYPAMIGVNLFDTQEQAEEAAARYRVTGISKPIVQGSKCWFEDSSGKKVVPI